MLRQLGDAAAAIPMFREELAGCRATLGDDHEDTRDSLRNLAMIITTITAATYKVSLYTRPYVVRIRVCIDHCSRCRDLALRT